MTLRGRLLSLSLATVTVVAGTFVMLNLDSLTEISLEVAQGSAEMAARQVQSFLVRRLDEAGKGKSIVTVEDTKRLWQEAASRDVEIAAMLRQAMAQSRAIIEINLAGEDGRILVSSNPATRGAPLLSKPAMRTLSKASSIDRAMALTWAGFDYETRVPLGIVGQKQPVFTIQVLSSPVFLRAFSKPAVGKVLVASGFALVLAILLAYWAADLFLRPLARISHVLDDIVEGRIPVSKTNPMQAARELAAIEAKLSLLGERFRSAREDATQLRLDLRGKLDAETRARIENQIALARRLSAINSLTRGVAHEIKNPLNSILLRLEMLRSRVMEETPEAEPEFKILSEEVNRLDRVVRTFLDFNRPVELAWADVDAGVEAADALQLVAPEAATKGVSSALSKPEEALLVKADAGLLRQAMLNILMNAIEAMETGGKLGVAVTKLGGICSIRISDNGPGIATEKLEKVFELYFTTKPKGSGIGLAMTFRSIQLHGGTIEVESEVGVGTTFEIKLPLVGVEAMV